MSKATAPKKTTAKIHFEEWMVEVRIKEGGTREAVKIKLNRDRVLMSQHDVDVLNEGVINMDLVNNNRLPLYYFPVDKKKVEEAAA